MEKKLGLNESLYGGKKKERIWRAESTIDIQISCVKQRVG